LGLGSTNSESLPRPIRAILSRKVVLAACSYHHTVFLCSDGTLFSCGRNDSGQLGHGDTADKKTPQAILSAPKNVVSISCGQFHTVASTSQGVVYACGKNDYGQLGMESSNHVKVFSKIPIGPDLDSVIQVCCGYYHTLMVSSTGVVAGFGRNDYGQVSCC
jgi:alpha-tubulin suppressor-like RCC1 family protein